MLLLDPSLKIAFTFSMFKEREVCNPLTCPAQGKTGFQMGGMEHYSGYEGIYIIPNFLQLEKLSSLLSIKDTLQPSPASLT